MCKKEIKIRRNTQVVLKEKVRTDDIEVEVKIAELAIREVMQCKCGPAIIARGREDHPRQTVARLEKYQKKVLKHDMSS